MGDIIDRSCDAFFDEECEYHGHDIGVSAPAGEVTNVIECEEYCHLFQVLFNFVSYSTYLNCLFRISKVYQIVNIGFSIPQT